MVRVAFVFYAPGGGCGYIIARALELAAEVGKRGDCYTVGGEELYCGDWRRLVRAAVEAARRGPVYALTREVGGYPLPVAALAVAKYEGGLRQAMREVCLALRESRRSAAGESAGRTETAAGGAAGSGPFSRFVRRVVTASFTSVKPRQPAAKPAASGGGAGPEEVKENPPAPSWERASSVPAGSLESRRVVAPGPPRQRLSMLAG